MTLTAEQIFDRLTELWRQLFPADGRQGQLLERFLRSQRGRLVAAIQELVDADDRKLHDLDVVEIPAANHSPDLIELNDGRWITADEARERYAREKEAIQAGRAFDPSGDYGVSPTLYPPAVEIKQGTIPLNTNLAKEILLYPASVRSYTLDNGFTGEPVEPGVWAWLNRDELRHKNLRFSRLTGGPKGYTAHVHSNKWFVVLPSTREAAIEQRYRDLLAPELVENGKYPTVSDPASFVSSKLNGRPDHRSLVIAGSISYIGNKSGELAPGRYEVGDLPRLLADIPLGGTVELSTKDAALHRGLAYLGLAKMSGLEPIATVWNYKEGQPERQSFRVLFQRLEPPPQQPEVTPRSARIMRRQGEADAAQVTANESGEWTIREDLVDGNTYFRVNGPRVDKPRFKALAAKSQAIGGFYVRGAGYSFTTRQDAETFVREAPRVLLNFAASEPPPDKTREEQGAASAAELTVGLDDVLVPWKPRHRRSFPPAYSTLAASSRHRVFYVLGDLTQAALAATVTVNGVPPTEEAKLRLARIKAAQAAKYEARQVQVGHQRGRIFVLDGAALTPAGADALRVSENSLRNFSAPQPPPGEELSGRDLPPAREVPEGGELVGHRLRSTESARQARAVKLRAAADKLDEQAQAALGQQRKTNTWKRSQEAAHATKQAFDVEHTAAAMRRIADALEAGEAPHLDGVSARTQVDLLKRMIHRAQDHRARDRGETPTIDIAEHVKFPWPRIWTSHFVHELQKVEARPGLRQAVQRLSSKMRGLGDVSIELQTEQEIDDLRTLHDKLKNGSSEDKWLAGKAGDALEEYDRVRRMGLDTPEKLRVALREFMTCCYAEARKESPAKIAERALVGIKIPGYFPTPRDLADATVALADLEPGLSVLEPSAGKGDLAEAILRAEPAVDLKVIERQHSLRSILEAKGFNIVGHDFLDHTGRYDHIIQNPPFEDNQDIDHVYHAFALLNPGGVLVSIMSKGPMFRPGKKEQAFRAWLEQHHAEWHDNPEGSFESSDRPTGVNTITVKLQKSPAVQDEVEEENGPPAPSDLELLTDTARIAADSLDVLRGVDVERVLQQFYALRKRDETIVQRMSALLIEQRPDLATKIYEALADLDSDNGTHFMEDVGKQAMSANIDAFDTAIAALDVRRPELDHPFKEPEGFVAAPDKPETRKAWTGRGDYQERREARVDRLEAAAGRSHGEAQRRWEASHQGLPDNGQPILVGHHSERRHRKAIERSHANMRKSIEAEKDARALSSMAKAAARNTAISSDDPNAPNKLREKIAKLEDDVAKWKAINKAVRAKDPHAALAALGLSPAAAERLLAGDFAGRKGIPDYEFTNTGANIRRLKQRLASLEQAAQIEAPEPFELGGGEVRWDTDENRVVVEMPRGALTQAEKHRRSEIMRSNGFVWSKTRTAYVRKANAEAWRRGKDGLRAIVGPTEEST